MYEFAKFWAAATGFAIIVMMTSCVLGLVEHIDRQADVAKAREIATAQSTAEHAVGQACCR